MRPPRSTFSLSGSNHRSRRRFGLGFLIDVEDQSGNVRGGNTGDTLGEAYREGTLGRQLLPRFRRQRMRRGIVEAGWNAQVFQLLAPLDFLQLAVPKAPVAFRRL